MNFEAGMVLSSDGSKDQGKLCTLWFMTKIHSVGPKNADPFSLWWSRMKINAQTNCRCYQITVPNGTHINCCFSVAREAKRNAQDLETASQCALLSEMTSRYKFKDGHILSISLPFENAGSSGRWPHNCDLVQVQDPRATQWKNPSPRPLWLRWGERDLRVSHESIHSMLSRALSIERFCEMWGKGVKWTFSAWTRGSSYRVNIFF